MAPCSLDETLRRSLRHSTIYSGFNRLFHELAGYLVKFRERLKGVLIAIALLIVCFPFAVIITIVTAPFWSWLELQTNVEAYGHSGPDEWCYLLVYALLVAGCGLVWSHIQRQQISRKPENS